MLQPELLLQWIGLLRRELPDLYLWAYTNGVPLTADLLGKLADAGLDELRFNLAATAYENPHVERMLGEAARRLARDGPNELRSAQPVPAWRRLLAQFRDPLIYLLLAAIAISLLAWWVEGAAGWPIDALVIALIVVANAVLGYVQEAKAGNAVAALARMTAVTSSVIRDGRMQRVASAELVRAFDELRNGTFIQPAH